MKKILIVLALALLCACEETIVLDLNENGSAVVIEALLTNQMGHHYVKVGRTGGFYDVGRTPRITDAIVTVTDELGNSFDFEHQPDSAGYYFAVNPFAGRVGGTYTLTVQAQGQTYTATETLLRVTTIDSLTVEYSEDGFVDDDGTERFYDVLIYTTEPQDTEDYYLFKFFRNGAVENEDGDGVYYANDDAIAENIEGIEFPDYYAVGDTMRLEMYSLTRMAYLFYFDLETNVNNDGGLFSPQPANPRSNISNGAMGLFQVSAVESASIVIEN